MAKINSDDPRTPVGCADPNPPTGLVLADCADPELNYGPIVNLYEFSEQFAEDPTAAAIAALLANAPTTPNATVTGAWGIGPMIVQVSRTPPSDGTPIRFNGVDYPAPADLSYGVTIQNTSDDFWEYARSTQKGGRPGYFYGVDANNNWFGGRNGMCGGKSRLKLRGNLPTGEKDLQTITGTITGTGFFDDKRIPSPVPAVFG